MVSKKILGVAIAAAMSVPAFAAIDMTATPLGGTAGAGTGAVVYAKESVTNAQITSGFAQVTNATDFDTTVALGFGVSAGSHAFVRIDLTNAKFKSLVGAADLSLTGKTAGAANDYVVQLAQGGAAGDAFVIFDITAVTAMAAGQALVLDLADMQVSPTAPATMQYAHYSTSPAAATATATNTTGALATDSYAFASIVPVLTTTITAGTSSVADVNATTPFTVFTGPSATATLGTVKFALASSKTVAGANVTTLSQVMDVAATKSKLALGGELDFIGKTDAATTATKLTFGGVNADVATPAASLVSSAKLSDLSGLAAGVDHSVVVTSNATTAINAGAYSLTFTPTAIADAAYPVVGATGALASIVRNGATAQVPYLTTNAGLNQKIILVNRGSSATTYSVTFTTETGVTATAGAAATGTLASKETKVIKASDLVTLTGGTRTAATIVALSPAGNIDAATQTVVTDPASVSYGSNDTVNLSVK